MAIGLELNACRLLYVCIQYTYKHDDKKNETAYRMRSRERFV